VLIWAEMDQLDSHDLLARYADGESAIAGEIFERYVRRLVALADARIAPALRRRVDAEDVVQSAYRSFFVHAREGDYALTRPGDLWRLLAAITLHKLRDQAGRHRAARRDYRREQAAGDDGDSSRIAALPASPHATPAEIAAAVDELEQIVGGLGDGVRDAVSLRIAGRTVDEIAQTLGRSPRTIRRYLDEARHQLARTFGAASPPDVSPLPRDDACATLNYADYVLLSLVGRGGMGRVYRAREKATGAIVAIKALRKDRQRDVRAVNRFLAEADILRRLDHPGIVKVRGVGRFPAGGYFLALDFVRGEDLERRFARSPIAIDDTLRIGVAVADAVDFAHHQGVVHCDLKPANVMIDDCGRAVVTDFGFAQLIAGDCHSPRLAVGGTRKYMAPEVRAGAAPTVAADVYGLGVLLEALVAGAQTHEGMSGLALDAIHSVAARCMREDPLVRYSTACDVAVALRGVEAPPP
jgi:RNA polymerase sigma factor (sigma-70 family)